MKNPQENPEGELIKNRAYQAEYEHEFPDKRNVPPFGLIHHLSIHMIGDNGHRRKIRHEIGQCSGLVRAEDIHAAKMLDGGKPLHNDLLFCHFLGAMGQIDADDGRQQLRSQPHRQSHRKKKRFQYGPVKMDIDGKYQENQGQRHFLQ